MLSLEPFLLRYGVVYRLKSVFLSLFHSHLNTAFSHCVVANSRKIPLSILFIFFSSKSVFNSSLGNDCLLRLITLRSKRCQYPRPTVRQHTVCVCNKREREREKRLTSKRLPLRFSSSMWRSMPDWSRNVCVLRSIYYFRGPFLFFFCSPFICWGNRSKCTQKKILQVHLGDELRMLK